MTFKREAAYEIERIRKEDVRHDYPCFLVTPKGDPLIQGAIRSWDIPLEANPSLRLTDISKRTRHRTPKEAPTLVELPRHEFNPKEVKTNYVFDRNKNEHRFLDISFVTKCPHCGKSFDSLGCPHPTKLSVPARTEWG